MRIFEPRGLLLLVPSICLWCFRLQTYPLLDANVPMLYTSQSMHSAENKEKMLVQNLVFSLERISVRIEFQFCYLQELFSSYWSTALFEEAISFKESPAYCSEKKSYVIPGDWTHPSTLSTYSKIRRIASSLLVLPQVQELLRTSPAKNRLRCLLLSMVLSDIFKTEEVRNYN